MIYCKVENGGRIPVKSYEGSVGYDIFSNEVITIPKGKRSLVSTGFSINMKDSDLKNIYFRVAPRSGLSVKGFDIGAGVIDPDYTGEIKVLFINNSEEDYTIQRYDRIAQLIPECVYMGAIEFCPQDKLTDTSRGDKGFGSSGK